MYQAKAETFLFENREGIIYHSFLQRKIPLALDGKDYYDLITPYGYGGPIITELKGDKKVLVEDFFSAFRKYCLENNIVSEFIRFHPLLENHRDFQDVLEVLLVRQTVATKLTCKDPFAEEFSKGARKTTRQALKKGFTWEIIERPTQLETFKKIYFNTMDRNEASDFYYFDDQYFTDLIDLLGDYIVNINIYCDGACISSGLYFTYQNYMHAHLSGTHKDYLRDNAAYILKYLSVNWGKEHGYHYIHYGGGTTNDPKDSLLTFKKRFTKETIFDFHVAKNIYNQEVYNMLTATFNASDSTFFPAYRDPKMTQDY